MHDLIHLGDRSGYLFDAQILFAARRTHFCHELVNLTDFIDDFGEALGNFFADLHALGCLADRAFDLTRGFAGGLGCTLGEGTHFLGDDGKSGTGFSRACGLDSGIEREDVGLKGNFVDRLDDLRDVVARCFNVLHGRGHGSHIVGASVGGFACLSCEIVSFARALGITVRDTRHLFE